MHYYILLYSITCYYILFYLPGPDALYHHHQFLEFNSDTWNMASKKSKYLGSVKMDAREPRHAPVQKAQEKHSAEEKGQTLVGHYCTWVFFLPAV